MVADGRLRETERRGEVADAGFSAGLGLNQAEQPESGRLGEHLEQGSETLGVGLANLVFEERRAVGRDGGELLHAEKDIDTCR